MNHSKWLWLQLFGGEGGGGTGASGDGGGDGAATGVTDGAAAEHQRLLELGVPEEKLRKRANRAKGQLPEGAVRTAPKQAQEQKAQEQVATAEAPTEEQTENPPARMSWEEIMADPEYNKQMQATVQQRLKTAKAAEENLAKLAPALELLAQRHGLDAKSMDYEALAKAINDDDVYYEDKALEQGKPLDEIKRKDQQERADVLKQRQEAETLEEQRMRTHIAKIEQQAEAMKKVFPNFSLQEEMKNPYFVRMTHPNIGISVEDAYHAIHHKEIMSAGMQVTAQQTAQKISNAIQAGARRPDENGTTGQSASVTTFDYSKASKAQRDALKREIFAARARGEKLYPGK